MKHLSITRAVVGAAVSLHLRGLKLGVKIKDRAVQKAMSNTDTAKLGVRTAEAMVIMAKDNRKEAIATENKRRRERDAFVSAARAEADILRRNHSVGA